MAIKWQEPPAEKKRPGCTCEADVTWSEGIPHWTPITNNCPQHGDEEEA